MRINFSLIILVTHTRDDVIYIITSSDSILLGELKILKIEVASMDPVVKIYLILDFSKNAHDGLFESISMAAINYFRSYFSIDVNEPDEEVGMETNYEKLAAIDVVAATEKGAVFIEKVDVIVNIYLVDLIYVYVNPRDELSILEAMVDKIVIMEKHRKTTSIEN